MFDRCKVIVDTALHSVDELEVFDQIEVSLAAIVILTKHLRYSEKICVAERMARIAIKLDQAALYAISLNWRTFTGMRHFSFSTT